MDYLDHLKQYDKDGKGALSPEELQEAIEGRESGWGGMRPGGLRPSLGPSLGP